MATRKEHQYRRARIRQLRQAEQLAQEAYIQKRNHRWWYFVVRLDAQQSAGAEGHQYEVQVLDRQGRATAIAYFTDPDATATVALAEHTIPSAVLHAAHRQLPGQGDYVNEAGESIPAW